MSDFIKYIKENNLVKGLEEAFNQNSVLEENHKGNPDYFKKENRIINSNYKIGDIVFVQKYLYSDYTKGNNHLFVIIDKNNFSVPIEYFVFILSSNIKKVKYEKNFLIEKNNKNKLDKNSIIKLDNIYQIFDNNILFKIGEVNIEDVEMYKQTYLEYNLK